MLNFYEFVRNLQSSQRSISFSIASKLQGVRLIYYINLRASIPACAITRLNYSLRSVLKNLWDSAIYRFRNKLYICIVGISFSIASMGETTEVDFWCPWFDGTYAILDNGLIWPDGTRTYEEDKTIGCYTQGFLYLSNYVLIYVELLLPCIIILIAAFGRIKELQVDQFAIFTICFIQG